MPKLGFGTWFLPNTEETTELVKFAFTTGYRLVDTAQRYGNEEAVGRAVGHVDRQSVFVTTKLDPLLNEPSRVRPALLTSLKRLNLDYVDLFLVHFPIALAPPGEGLPCVPLIATWHAMQELVEEGLCRHIGLSNITGLMLHDLLCHSPKIPPAVLQLERHPYCQQERLVQYARERGIPTTAYSSLGTAAVAEQENEEKQKLTDHSNSTSSQPPRLNPILIRDPVVLELADKYYMTPAQVLLKWALQTDSAVIPKSTHPDRIKENFATLKRAHLTPADMARLAGLETGKRYMESRHFQLTHNVPLYW